MPTCTMKYTGKVKKAGESNPPLPPPQSVRVPISLGQHHAVAGHKEKNYCPSGTSTSHNPLGQERTNPALTLPDPPHATLKTPPELLQSHPLKLGNHQLTSAKNAPTPLKNNDVQVFADSKSTAALPMKRTKKNVKKKSVPKASARRTKGKKYFHRKEGGGSVAERKTIQITKSPPSGDVTALATVAKQKSLKSRSNLQEKSEKGKESKGKAKRVRFSPQSGAPAKKRSKKQDPEDSSSLPQAVGNAVKSKRGRSTQTPPKSRAPKAKKSINDKQIERALLDVADTVAEELRYCASLLGAVRPKGVIDCSEGSPVKKRDTGPPSPNCIGTSPITKCAELKTNFSVKITNDDTIYPVKNIIAPSKECEKDESSQGRMDTPDPGDVSTVAEAVKGFVLEVYFPFLIAAKKKSGNDAPNAGRIKISTLLAIREMLIMNADKLFLFPVLKKPSTHGAKRGKDRRPHVLADTIVRNAAKRMSGISAEFVQAARDYDSQSDDFQFSLLHADAQSVYSHPEGDKVSPEESMLAKASFNYARERHPLISGGRSTLRGSSAGAGCPMPTACATFYIEEATPITVNKEQEAEEILNALNEALNSNSPVKKGEGTRKAKAKGKAK
ncbi:hypothetical protein ACHAWF_015487 [Thalassiosira exigua]